MEKYAGSYIEQSILSMIKQDGLFLQFIKPEYQTEKICLSAVRQNKYALEYVEKYYQSIADYLYNCPQYYKELKNKNINKLIQGDCLEKLKELDKCKKGCCFLDYENCYMVMDWDDDLGRAVEYCSYPHKYGFRCVFDKCDYCQELHCVCYDE